MSHGWTVTSALAPSFAWVATGSDVRITPLGSPEIGVEIASGVYRMHLGPSAGVGRDFLRAAESAVNATLSASGHGEVVTVTMGAEGRITLTSTAPVTLGASPGLRALGLDPAGPATNFLATRGPQHLALIVSASGGEWETRDLVSMSIDGAGRSYSLGEVTTAFERTVDIDLIPYDPSAGEVAESPATPWHPARSYWGARGDASVGRVWSWLDVTREAQNVECAAALWCWRELLASTSASYDLVRLGEASLRSPKPERRAPTWNRYVRHALGLWLPAGAPTGTRG